MRAIAMAMMILTAMSTAELERACGVVDSILGDVLVVKAARDDAARVEEFKTRYVAALEKVLRGRFDSFENEGLRGEIDRIMAWAGNVFGPEFAEELGPETEKYLRSAFKLGQAMRVVPDNVQVLWDAPRQEALDWLVEHDRFWIGNVFPEHLADGFRETILDGMKQGLGRDDIARSLRDRLFGTPDAPTGIEYYRRVASTTVNRARNWGGVFSLHTAGFTEYEIRAVRDERTSPICLQMDGTVFRVSDAMESVQKALAGPPSAIEGISPFPRYDSERDEHYIERGGERAYLGGRSTAWLADNGLSLPPYHCNCFPQGTPVLTARGWVPIEQVRIGDEVYTHRLRLRTVYATPRSVSDSLVRIRTRAGREVLATPDHPVCTARGWVAAAGLRLGDTLTVVPGEMPDAAERAEVVPMAPQEVFNLSVEGDETYFAGGILVHNCRTTYVVSREEYAEREAEEALIVDPEVPTFQPFTEAELAGRNALQLRMLAREKQIKYFRVMNKQELMVVLTHPERCEEIARIAKARWQHKPVPDPGAEIARLADDYRKKGIRELMEEARQKGIRNFRVMTKDQLVTVLSDPSKHDEVQQAVRAKLRAARAQRGSKPGTTRADELDLEDVVARKESAVDRILTNAASHGRALSEDFRRDLKEWLREFNLDHLEQAAERGLQVGLWDNWEDVPWRISARNFSGLYQRDRYRIALIDRKPEVLFHEFGHFLDDVLQVTRGGKSSLPREVQADVFASYNGATSRAAAQMASRRPSWKGRAIDWRKEWKEFWVMPGLDTVSAYALSSPTEFWAECIEAYMKTGDRLQMKEPKMYELIKQHVFSGREFLKWLLGWILAW